MKKRFLSFVLVATLLMSMIVMPANAADGVTMSLSAVGFSTENVTSKYVKETGPVTTLKPNETVAVKVTITNNTSEELNLAGYRIELNYDSRIFEATAFSWENDDGAGTSGPIALASSKKGGLTWTPITNKMDGAAAWTATESNAATIPANDSLILGYLLLKAKTAVERCETAFNFVEGVSQFQSESAANYITAVANTGEEITLSNVTYTPATVSIDGTDPVLDRVTVTDADGKIVLDSKAENPSYKVEINGTTDYTYYAHAYSKMGTDITSSVTWTIGTVANNNGTVITTGGANAGQIVVAKNAMPISAAVEAKLDNVTADAGNFVVGRADGSEDTITSLSISCDNTTLIVPADDKTETATFSVEAKNIYDEIILNPSIVWKIADSSDGNLASNNNSGVTFTRGLLTLTSKTKAYTGTYTVYAYAGAIKSNEIPVTIKLADPEATELEIAANATTTFAVPTANSNGDPTTQPYDLPAVTVKDQYGRDIENRTLTWQTMGSDGEAVYPGITIENGKLVITSEAAKPELFPKDKNEYQVPIRVICGDKYADFTVTVTREARKAASIAVSGGPTAALLVPASGESAVTSNEKFTAVVKDQYGQEMNDQTVTWGITKTGSTEPTATGVSVENGIVTVSNDAKGDVPSTAPVEYTVTVTVDGKSATTTIQIKRAEPVAKIITVARKGSEDTLLIPGLDSTEKTRQAEFVATVTDQYDAEIQNPSINWSISAPYEVPGVTIDPATGVVSVTIDAAKRIYTAMTTPFTVTAAVNGTELKDSTQTLNVKREDIRIVGFHLYDHTGIASNDEHGRLLDTGSSVIISNGENVLFDILPHTQYGDDMTWSTIWQVEIFAPDGSQAIPTDSDKETTESEDSVGYRTKLPITSAVKDGTYRIVITETNPETGATPIKSEYSINLMRKQDAGLTISGGDDAASKTVTYGETFTLTATAANHGTTGSKWGLSGIDSTILDTVRHDGGNLTLKALKAGETTFTLTYEDDTYYGSVTYTVTVSPKEVTAVLVNGVKVSKAYDGTTAGGSIVLPNNISAPVQLTGVISTDELTVAPTLTGAYSTKDVHTGATNEFSLTLTLSGDAAGNYRLKNSSVAIPSEITPKPVRISGLTFESRQFAMNGYSATIDTLTFDGVVSGETLAYETGLIRVANNNVGTQSVEAFTVTLKNDNYCWTADVVGSTLTIPAGTYSVVITKAPYSDKTAETGAKFGNSASFPLKSDLFPAGANVQSITVTAPTGSIFDGTPSVTGTTLNYKIAANAKPGQTGTLTLAVESQNYNNYNITITVTVLDKTPQAIEAKNVTMIYGDTASGYVTNLSSLKGAVSYTLSNGRDVISVDSSTGRITALKPGEALISIYAAGDENTKDANKVITVTVTKRPLTVTANNISTYVGDKQPTLTYRFDGLVNNDNVGTWELTLSIPANVKDPMKTAGEYPIIFGVHTDGTDEDKYDITLVPGKLTVTNYTIIDSTPLGSDITVIPAPGGTTRISTPKAVGGATVTITVTPDKDKELKSLEVIDENGSRLPLTDLGNGRFSFVMPAGKVSVSAVYGDVNDYVNPYLDVNESDWYYEAVKYVTVNGLMNGTGASRFEPNLATSRAMIWTILARMSGVDTTGGSVWYAAAQQWAIATGVSDGTNPNGTITREQLAAMLYRYAVSKGMVTAPVTADLSIYSDAASVSAYAVEAMQWAVGTGLINGMAGKLNPQGSATRAQVATMLMRFAQLSK